MLSRSRLRHVGLPLATSPGDCVPASCIGGSVSPASSPRVGSVAHGVSASPPESPTATTASRRLLTSGSGLLRSSNVHSSPAAGSAAPRMAFGSRVRDMPIAQVPAAASARPALSSPKAGGASAVSSRSSSFTSQSSFRGGGTSTSAFQTAAAAATRAAATTARASGQSRAATAAPRSNRSSLEDPSARLIARTDSSRSAPGTHASAAPAGASSTQVSGLRPGAPAPSACSSARSSRLSVLRGTVSMSPPSASRAASRYLSTAEPPLKEAAHAEESAAAQPGCDAAMQAPQQQGRMGPPAPRTAQAAPGSAFAALARSADRILGAPAAAEAMDGAAPAPHPATPNVSARCRRGSLLLGEAVSATDSLRMSLRHIGDVTGTAAGSESGAILGGLGAAISSLRPHSTSAVPRVARETPASPLVAAGSTAGGRFSLDEARRRLSGSGSVSGGPSAPRSLHSNPRRNSTMCTSVTPPVCDDPLDCDLLLPVPQLAPAALELPRAPPGGVPPRPGHRSTTGGVARRGAYVHRISEEASDDLLRGGLGRQRGSGGSAASSNSAHDLGQRPYLNVSASGLAPLAAGAAGRVRRHSVAAYMTAAAAAVTSELAAAYALRSRQATNNGGEEEATPVAARAAATAAAPAVDISASALFAPAVVRSPGQSPAQAAQGAVAAKAPPPPPVSGAVGSAAESAPWAVAVAAAPADDGHGTGSSCAATPANTAAQPDLSERAHSFRNRVYPEGGLHAWGGELSTGTGGAGSGAGEQQGPQERARSFRTRVHPAERAPTWDGGSACSPTASPRVRPSLELQRPGSFTNGNRVYPADAGALPAHQWEMPELDAAITAAPDSPKPVQGAARDQLGLQERSHSFRTRVHPSGPAAAAPQVELPEMDDPDQGVAGDTSGACGRLGLQGRSHSFRTRVHPAGCMPSAGGAAGSSPLASPRVRSSLDLQRPGSFTSGSRVHPAGPAASAPQFDLPEMDGRAQAQASAGASSPGRKGLPLRTNSLRTRIHPADRMQSAGGCTFTHSPPASPGDHRPLDLQRPGSFTASGGNRVHPSAPQVELPELDDPQAQAADGVATGGVQPPGRSHSFRTRVCPTWDGSPASMGDVAGWEEQLQPTGAAARAPPARGATSLDLRRPNSFSSTGRVRPAGLAVPHSPHSPSRLRFGSESMSPLQHQHQHQHQQLLTLLKPSAGTGYASSSEGGAGAPPFGQSSSVSRVVAAAAPGADGVDAGSAFAHLLAVPSDLMRTAEGPAAPSGNLFAGDLVVQGQVDRPRGTGGGDGLARLRQSIEEPSFLRSTSRSGTGSIAGGARLAKSMSAKGRVVPEPAGSSSQPGNGAGGIFGGWAVLRGASDDGVGAPVASSASQAWEEPSTVPPTATPPALLPLRSPSARGRVAPLPQPPHLQAQRRQPATSTPNLQLSPGWMEAVGSGGGAAASLATSCAGLDPAGIDGVSLPGCVEEEEEEEEHGAVELRGAVRSEAGAAVGAAAAGNSWTSLRRLSGVRAASATTGGSAQAITPLPLPPPVPRAGSGRGSGLLAALTRSISRGGAGHSEHAAAAAGSGALSQRQSAEWSQVYDTPNDVLYGARFSERHIVLGQEEAGEAGDAAGPSTERGSGSGGVAGSSQSRPASGTYSLLSPPKSSLQRPCARPASSCSGQVLPHMRQHTAAVTAGGATGTPAAVKPGARSTGGGGGSLTATPRKASMELPMLRAWGSTAASAGGSPITSASMFTRASEGSALTGSHGDAAVAVAAGAGGRGALSPARGELSVLRPASVSSRFAPFGGSRSATRPFVTSTTEGGADSLAKQPETPRKAAVKANEDAKEKEEQRVGAEGAEAEAAAAAAKAAAPQPQAQVRPEGSRSCEPAAVVAAADAVGGGDETTVERAVPATGPLVLHADGDGPAHMLVSISPRAAVAPPTAATAGAVAAAASDKPREDKAVADEEANEVPAEQLQQQEPAADVAGASADGKDRDCEKTDALNPTEVKLESAEDGDAGNGVEEAEESEEEDGEACEARDVLAPLTENEGEEDGNAGEDLAAAARMSEGGMSGLPAGSHMSESLGAGGSSMTGGGSAFGSVGTCDGASSTASKSKRRSIWWRAAHKVKKRLKEAVKKVKEATGSRPASAATSAAASAAGSAAPSAAASAAPSVTSVRR